MVKNVLNVKMMTEDQIKIRQNAYAKITNIRMKLQENANFVIKIVYVFNVNQKNPINA